MKNGRIIDQYQIRTIWKKQKESSSNFREGVKIIAYRLVSRIGNQNISNKIEVKLTLLNGIHVNVHPEVKIRSKNK